MSRTLKPFSIWRYSVVTVSLHVLLLTMFSFLVPNWKNQIAAGWIWIAGVFLMMNLINCFFEWGFHRYVLHTVLARWLQTFTESHRLHHRLTPVKYIRDPSSLTYLVKSRYPIVEEKQYESQAFPWWALIVFWAVFTPIIVGLQLLFPKAPFLLSGYSAVTFSLTLYEVFHAIEHRPESWWMPRLQHPRFGRIWKKLYGFHFMHHANPACNLGISGFFGLPVADWVMGTYRLSEAVLPLGQPVEPKDFSVPPPSRIVQKMDHWSRNRESRIRHT